MKSGASSGEFLTNIDYGGGNVKQGVGQGEVWRVEWINKTKGSVSSSKTSISDPTHNHTVTITTKNSSNNSNQETRVRSKFFSLLIYAGYPIA